MVALIGHGNSDRHRALSSDRHAHCRYRSAGRMVLYDLLKYRTITRITVVAFSTCAALLLLQGYFIGSEFGSYNGTYHATLGTVGAHLISYPRTLAGFWVSSNQTVFSFFLLGVISLLTLA